MIAAACLAALNVALPPLGLAEGLDHGYCVAGRKFAARWLALKQKESADRGDAWTPGDVFDACDRVNAWQEAADATDRTRDPWQRRFHLRRLVDAVGWRAVVSGQLVSPVPLELIPAR
jgi:hypothetical protein